MEKNPDQFLWVESYRPHKVEDCILPERLKQTFQQYINQKNIPNLIFYGTPGVGKTTVAKALCGEIGCDFMVVNGSEERGIDTLRTKIKSYATSLSFNEGRKVVIIDEADFLTPESQACFRGVMEETAINCSFIFTCNFKAKLIEALHSRCSVIEFKIALPEKVDMAKAFLKRLKEILDTEKVKYNVSVLAEIVQKHFPDYRRTLNEIQRYAISSKGDIDVGILVQVADVQLKDLMKYLKEKDFRQMRKWVALNSDVDPQRIYSQVYNILYDYLTPESIPQAVVYLADYQYKSCFCADGELCLVACLTEIMGSCVLK